MNAADIAQMAFDAMPDGFKGPVTFRTAAGSTTTATQAVGAPARSSGDGFKADSTIREKARRLSVYPQGLTFAPLTGMYATWEGEDWNVIAAHPVIPSGSIAASMYRVTLQK